LLLTEGRLSRLGPSVATDFRSNIITAQPLDEDMLRDKITYRGELEDTPPQNPRGPVEFAVTLDQTGVFSMSQMIEYLTSSRAGDMFDSKEDFTQALNIVLGKY